MSLPGLELPTLSFAPPPEIPDPTVLTVDLDHMITSRLLIQGSSGAGKGWAIRTLLEQTHGRVQQLVLDKEGEFSTLRERFDYILAGSEGDVPATPQTARLLCRQLMDLGASAVLDLYDLALPDRQRFVRLFLEELMALPKEMWRPLLVVIDEAHFFCPEGGSTEASSAVISLCAEGRKRGFCAVLATQRLSKLSKDAAAELRNKMIGLTSLDVDVRRAADDLGFGREQAARLKELSPGEFFVVGPAVAKKVVLARTGNVSTTHPRAGQIAAYTPPPPAEAVQALLEQLRGLAEEAEEADRAEKEKADRTEALERQVEELRARLPEGLGDASGPKTVERIVEKIVEKRVEVPVYVVAEGQITALADKADAFRAVAKDAMNVTLELVAASDEILRELRRVAAVPTAKAAPEEAAATAFDEAVPEIEAGDAQEPATSEAGDKLQGFSITRPQQAILDTVAALEALGLAQPERAHVAVFAGTTPTSSAFTNNLGALRTGGLLTYPVAGRLQLTEAGRRLARRPDAPPSRVALQEAWVSRLPPARGRLLKVLIACYPSPQSREALAESAGVSAGSSGFTNNLGALRSLGLISYPKSGQVAATDVLFPAGLA